MIYMYKRNFTNKYKKGFTLIEMIVSLGIFMVVALIAVGALLKVMDANKKSISLKTSINNLNFVLESMSREMRVGSHYKISGTKTENVSYDSTPNSNISTIADSNWTLSFISSEPSNNCTDSSGKKINLIYAYSYDKDLKKLMKAQENPQTCGEVSSTDYYDLTSKNIEISKSEITVDNSKQPFISFFIEGSSGIRDKDKTGFAIQSMVSQRIK